MNSSAKWAIGLTAGVIALPLLAKGAAAAKKAVNAIDNIVIKPSFGRIHGLEKGANGKPTSNLVVYFKADMYNYSGFDLSIDNLFQRLEYWDGSAWQNAGISPAVQKEVRLPNNGRVTLDLPFSLDLISTVPLLVANPKTQMRLVTVFDWNSLQQTVEYKFKFSDYFNLKDISGGISNILAMFKKTGMKGIDSPELTSYV